MRSEFVRFPQMWVTVLDEQRASGTVYRVALELLAEASWSYYGHVRLANKTLRGRGVSRQSKWRALQVLRKAGLIAVQEQPGKSPVVRVRFRR